MKILPLLILFSHFTHAQTLNLPTRNVTSQTGSQVVASITSLSLHDREEYILNEVLTGNVPMFYRSLVPITDSALIGGLYKEINYYTIPDYLALGSDQDYFLCPMTPILGQVIADSLGCILPTSKMVDQIWSHASVKMQPQTIPPSAQMTTVPVFDDHNDMVTTSRQSFLPGYPLGNLVGGDKKDVIISNLIYTSSAPARVVIYGWHYPTGGNIQPRYAGHIDTYADYSHGIRLIQNEVTVDGSIMLASDILASSTLYSLLSDEGIISQPFYPDTASSQPVIITPEIPKSFCLLQITQTSCQLKITTNSNVVQYELYSSLDGTNFTGPITFSGNNYTITNCTPNVINYFKIKASNSAGTSNFSELLAITPSTTSSQVLIVNAFDRNTAGNSKDFVIQHGTAINNYDLVFSSTTNEGYNNGLLDLNNYEIVDYILGEESTVDETFSDAEQTKIKAFLDQGGYLYVSGAEIGWDLDHLGATTDVDFYENYLKSNYIFDAPNEESGIYYQIEGASGSPFSSTSTTSFDNGTQGTYDVMYPDVIVGLNGGISCLQYSNLINNGAGICYEGLFPNATIDTGKIVYHAFPFETIYPESSRFSIMSEVLDYFLLPATDPSLNIHNQNVVVKCFPNPIDRLLKIQSAEKFTNYKLITINGALIAKGSINIDNTINLNDDIVKGIYLLSISNVNTKKQIKLIKE